MNKVHLRGIPCKAGSMWICKVLTSNGDKSKITCKTCLKQIKKHISRNTHIYSMIKRHDRLVTQKGVFAILDRFQRFQNLNIPFKGIVGLSCDENYYQIGTLVMYHKDVYIPDEGIKKEGPYPALYWRIESKFIGDLEAKVDEVLSKYFNK